MQGLHEFRMSNFVVHLPAPVAQYDGRSDLRGRPAGALIVGDEPDVVPASRPIPVRQLCLKPPLRLQQHSRCMHHPRTCKALHIAGNPQHSS